MKSYNAYERHIDLNHEPNLPTRLAMVAMSRPLRGILRRRTPFIAALIIPLAANIHLYKSAASALFEHADRPENRETDSIILIEDKTDFSAHFRELRRQRGVKRCIILVADKGLASNEIRIAADLMAMLTAPTPRDYQIAANRMGFGRIDDADAEFLATLPPERADLAFRRGRQVSVAIGKLRLHVDKDIEPPALKVQTGPTLHDLSGYGDAKTWGLEFAEDFKAWIAGDLGWQDIESGILLSGPPGSGKTSYASALARTCDVPLISGSAGQWQAAGHLGDMLKAMRASFAEAIKKAPSVFLIDEFDSFSTREADPDGNANYHRQVINALLELLDGSTPRDGVLVIGATNRPEIIDPALLRPGRLERHFSIELPDIPSRESIFRFHLRGELKDDDIGALAIASHGWSGADIESCVRDARHKARRSGRLVQFDDLESVMPPLIVVPMHVQRCVAIHELGHAIVGLLLDVDQLVSVSLKRTVANAGMAMALGHTKFEEHAMDRRTSAYFRNFIAMLLGGIAAEDLMFKSIGGGGGGHPSGDLSKATDLATMIEVGWGMGSTLSVEQCESSRELAALRNSRKDLRKAVEKTLRTEFERAKLLLADHRSALFDLHERLLRDGSLTAEEVRCVVEQPTASGSQNREYRDQPRLKGS